MKKFLVRTIRKYLGTKGLQITRKRYDVDSFFIDEKYKNRLISDTAEVVSLYMENENIFPVSTKLDIGRTVTEFFELFPDSPAKTRNGGCGFNALLWLYTVTKAFNPRYIMESGSFEGGSAWIFRRAAPLAEIHCFDLDLSRFLFKDDSIHLHENDWTAHDFHGINPRHCICFFDDHVDQVKRLLEAHERGFRYLIFDDNTPVNFQYLATDGGATLDFINDKDLVDGELIEWVMLGTKYSYRPDKVAYEKARNLIREIRKVPSLHWKNGFVHGTPLTFVVLRD